MQADSNFNLSAYQRDQWLALWLSHNTSSSRQTSVQSWFSPHPSLVGLAKGSTASLVAFPYYELKLSIIYRKLFVSSYKVRLRYGKRLISLFFDALPTFTMQPLTLLIFSTFALANYSQSASLSTCILGNQCSQIGYSCTPTSSCGGLCLTSQTYPPVIPCTIGHNGPCPTGSTCTPTEYCTAGPTAPCRGQCIATNRPPPNTSNLPTIPCEVGASSSCPTNAFCTPTEVCNGVCRTAPSTGSTLSRSTPTSTGISSSSTPPPITPTTTVPPLPSCTIGGDASCSSGSSCTPLANCYGFCHSGISSPTILAPATATYPPPQTTASNVCIVGRPANDNGCPTNSYCLPTQTCAGLCLNTVIPPPPTTTTFLTTQTPPTTPPTIPYTTISGTPYATCIWEQPGLYATPPCPDPSSSCSPTPSCGGQCYTTAPGIATTCTVGGFCAANAGGGRCQADAVTCNTAGCAGRCPTTACSISGNQCPTEAICSQTEYCYGICISTSPATVTGTVATPSSSLRLTSTATLTGTNPSGTCGWVYVPCGSGYKCMNSKGKECGLGDAGHCVPDQEKKNHRFLAGRHFDGGYQ